MKKLLKILPTLMIVFAILTNCATIFATTIGNVPIGPKTDSAGAVSGIGNQILGIIQVIGTVIAVGVLMVLGIKYMMGSAEEKAEYKKTMLPYLIGAVLLFAAVNLAKYVADLAGTISSSGGASGNTPKT